VARDAAKAAGVPRESVRASGLRAGSVLVDLVLGADAVDAQVL
jgi:hypothetical protein